MDDGLRPCRLWISPVTGQSTRGATTTPSMPGPTCTPITALTSRTATSAAAQPSGQPIDEARGRLGVVQVMHGDVDVVAAARPPGPERPATAPPAGPARATAVRTRSHGRICPSATVSSGFTESAEPSMRPRPRSGRRAAGTPGCRRRSTWSMRRPDGGPGRRPPPLPPARAASAADSTANPAAMATVRQSTTMTGTAAVAGRVSAAAQVPEIAALRCTETTAEYPARPARHRSRRRSPGDGRDVVTRRPARNAAATPAAAPRSPVGCARRSTTCSGTTATPRDGPAPGPART